MCYTRNKHQATCVYDHSAQTGWGGHLRKGPPPSWGDLCWGSLRFPMCSNMLLHIGNLKEIPWDLRFRRKNHVPIFGSTEKLFFGKVRNFFEHQDRCKICSRIEWKHSQPLKITLRPSLKENIIFFVLVTQNRVPTFWDYSIVKKLWWIRKTKVLS